MQDEMNAEDKLIIIGISQILVLSITLTDMFLNNKFSWELFWFIMGSTSVLSVFGRWWLNLCHPKDKL